MTERPVTERPLTERPVIEKLATERHCVRLCDEVALWLNGCGRGNGKRLIGVHGEVI